MKNRLLPRVSEFRQRLILTAAEKRVIVFVLAAFILGLTVKHYRQTHASPIISPPTQAEPSQKSKKHKLKLSPPPTDPDGEVEDDQG